MNEEELKSLWQSQPIMTVSYSLEQLQQDAVGFRRKIVRVYVQESIAALIVALIFGYFAWVSPVLPMRIGGGLVVVGVASENGKNRTLSVRGCWNPAVESREGYTEVLRHVPGRHATHQQFIGRYDLAVGH